MSAAPDFDRQVGEVHRRATCVLTDLVLVLERGHLTEIARRELLGRIRDVHDHAARLPYRPKGGG